MADEKMIEPEVAGYTARDRTLAAHLAYRLRGLASGLGDVMSPHALATAMLGAGVETALIHMSKEQVAEWLGIIAEELLDDESSEEAVRDLVN